jgi:hypothetical protein
MKKLLREPLVQFLVAGALLFAYFEWRGGGSGPGSTRITITPGLVEHLASGFARTWQRPPSDEELQEWLDRHPDVFRPEVKVAMRQVYLNPERRGGSADAATLLGRLRSAGPGAKTRSGSGSG